MGDESVEWGKIGSRPIRAEAPSGDPIRYDPSFERLQAEMNKLETLSGQPVDWKEVVILAREIIEGKSKDLLVLSYLCLGLFEEKGYAGLFAGLSCVEGLITTFWDTLYPEPKRMRGRINAISWLSEKVGAAVSHKTPSVMEQNLISSCIQQINTLEKLLNEKLGNDSPGLGDIRRAVENRLREIESSRGVVSRPERPTEVKPELEAGGSIPVISNKIESQEDAGKIFQEAGDMIRKAVSFVRIQNPFDPWPYRIVRSLIWAKIDDLPSNDSGDTRIPPPPPHLRERFQTLIKQGAWMELLNQTEDHVHESPFWLDIQYLSGLALSNLGPSYARAKGAVYTETFTLLRRLPGLLECKFSDGMPFADDDTRKLVKTESDLLNFRESSKAVPVEAPISNKEANRIKETCEKAYTLLREGHIKEAIDLFQQEMIALSSHRDRFITRFELAKLCLEAGYPKVALSQLEGLEQEMARVSLDEWEPALSLKVLQTFWSVLNQLLQDSKQTSPELTRQADMIYGRMCRINALSVLDLDKKRGWFGR